MAGASDKPGNPYVGPRPFEQDERDLFFGRDEEIEILVGLVLARRAALLFAASGAGKSSLIQAGLIPELTRQETVGHGSRARTVQKMRVLPMAKVGAPAPSGAQPVVNAYVFSTLHSLLPDAEPETLAGLTLAEGLAYSFSAPAPGSDGESPPEAGAPGRSEPFALSPDLESTLLVLDQFEELFTHHTARHQEREAFFRQVSEALVAHPRLHVLFSMREDYIAELTPYAALLPEQLRPRFRLELLGPEAARQAIQEPARKAGVDFSDAAAAKLVDDLRRVRVQRLDGSIEEQVGPYVEPVQLQVVCRRLWDKLPAGQAEIGVGDVEEVGDVDAALRAYYAEQVAAVAVQTGVSERAIREWCDRQLITEQGIRGQVLQAPEQSQGLDNRAIWPLVDAHLVRAEKRRGVTWFELAHDRLIEPVRADNAAWWAAHLSAVQRQAALWEEQGRQEGLLLRGTALVEGETWAHAHSGELNEVEREFLAECRVVRARAEREARQARRIRWLALGATLFSIVAIALAVVAGFQTRAAHTAQGRAEEQARRAFSGQLAAQSEAVIQEFPQRSLLLALEAFHAFPTPPLPSTEQALRDALGGGGGLSLHGHGGAVLSAAFSPDGRWLLTTSRDDTVRLWDVSALAGPNPGSALPTSAAQVLRGHEDDVMSGAFSPDGRWLATGSADRTIRLWPFLPPSAAAPSPEQAAAPLVLRGHADVVTAVAFSPDGHWLASASWDATVRLWNLEAILGAGPAAADQAEAAYVLRGHEGQVWSVAFGLGGRWLVTAGLDGTARLWDLSILPKSGTGGAVDLQPAQVLHANSGGVVAAAFSPDGHWLATGGEDNLALLWDASALQSGGTPGQLVPGEPLALRGHKAWVTSVAFGPDGRWLATGSDDGTARLWDLQASDPSGEPRVLRGHEGPVTAVAFRPDGQWLVSASGDQTARLWPVPTGTGTAPSAASTAVEPLVLRGHEAAVWSVAFSPDGRRLATAGDDATVQVNDIASGESWALHGHQGRVTSLAFRPGGRWLASGSLDGTIRLWDLSDLPGAAAGLGAGPLVLPAGQAGVTALTFSPDGRWLATGGDDRLLRLWDLAAVLDLGVKTGGEPAPSRTLPGHGDQITSLAFTPDGRWLASGSRDRTVRLWNVLASAPGDLPADIPVRILTGADVPITSLAFSPNGRWLATGGGGWDTTARLWDTAVLLAPQSQGVGSLDAVSVLRGHASAITSLAFSPDGGRLATASLDDTARLWVIATSPGASSQAQTVAEPIVLRGHEDALTGVAFSPDAQWVATGSLDDTSRLWRARLDDLMTVACLVAGRNLTQDEWDQYFPGQPYHRTCDNWPLPPPVVATSTPGG